MNHTRFPREDHLPYWASGQQSYEGWSCRVYTCGSILCNSDRHINNIIAPPSPARISAFNTVSKAGDFSTLASKYQLSL